MSKNAMRQALDALEMHTTIEGGYCSCCGHQPCLKTCSVIQAIAALRAALDAPEPDTNTPTTAQALTDTENQPNQYGVSFGMRGPQMTFTIGNQSFTLAYEPDEPDEFEFMRDMLIHAMSVFTPDVKTTEPLSDVRIEDVLRDYYPCQKYAEYVSLCRAVEQEVRGEMSLPPLPEHIPIHKFMSAYAADQMREYGQKCYEQGKADAAKGADSGRTPTFAPFDAEDDLK